MEVKLSQLFFNRKSKRGLILPILGLLIGFIVIPLIIQINHDVQTVVNGNDDDYQYLQISKEVGVSNALGLGSINFSDEEVSKIKRQSFVEDVAQVTSNNFRVYVKAPQGSFDGYMHSVPDHFLDVKPEAFKWEEGQEEIPVIISNQFFTLLNTGILPAQGHPAIPKVAIKQLSLPVYLGRGNKQIKMRVRVVGYSDRITTVIVPNNFVEWANNRFHPNQKSANTLAILKVKDSGNPSLEKYLDRNDYQVNKEKLVAQKGLWVIQLILGVFLILGLLVGIMSLNSIVLFVKLIMKENFRKIEMLLHLGYKTVQIRNVILQFFSIAMIMALLLGFSIDYFIVEYLHSIGSSVTAVEFIFDSTAMLVFPIIGIVIIGYLAYAIKKVTVSLVR